MKKNILKRIILFSCLTLVSMLLSTTLYLVLCGPINISYQNVNQIGIVDNTDSKKFYKVDDSYKNAFIKDAKKIVPHKSLSFENCKCKDAYMIRICYTNNTWVDYGVYDVTYYDNGQQTSNTRIRQFEKNKKVISLMIDNYYGGSLK